MSLRLIHCLLFLSLAGIASDASAGFFNNNGELDESFNPLDLPGRLPILFDVNQTNYTDFGINAAMDENGRLTSVAMVDINNPDTGLVGIGLSRHLFNGAVDSLFQSGGKRVRDAGMTTLVDACFGPTGKITVAGMAPGANGSAGAKDVALARFNVDGSDDSGFSGDGFNAYSLGDSATDRDEAITDLVCLDDGSVVMLGWYYSNSFPTTKAAFAIQVGNNGQAMVGGLGVGPGVVGADLQYAAGLWDGQKLVYAANRNATATIGFLSINNGSIGGFPGESDFSFSAWCPSLNNPSVVGIAQLPDARYVATVLYRDGSNVTRHALANISVGETRSMSCQTVDFGGAGNAGMSPPVVIADRVFIGLGFQPFGTGPIPSRARGYIVRANGSIDIDTSFGIGGMSEWYFPHSGVSSGNNNRSFIQQMVTSNGYLYALGTRYYSGNDVDAALTRLGGQGPFKHSFEDPLPPK